MSDRELLELAAKAAGIEIQRSRLDDVMCKDFLLVERKIDGGAIGWNPLTDDGDALRLAVKLNLIIGRSYLNDDALVIAKKTFEPKAFEPLSTDPLAATRRAIVRVAAEIGKEMK